MGSVIGGRLALILGLALLSCDHGPDNEHARRVTESQTRDRNYREHDQQLERDRATVRQYREWTRRVHALDHTSLGLPAPDESMSPATDDTSFCERLPATRTLRPEELVDQYRRHAEQLRAAAFPSDFTSYRAHYLAERQLARLACIARDGGSELTQAFVRLLDDDSVAVRYTAAVHAINLELARNAGFETLRQLAGQSHFFTHVAAKAIADQPTRLTLGFDLNIELERALDRLRARARRPQARQGTHRIGR